MYFLKGSSFWALFSLLAFLGVYFFKKKSKNVPVSTLMFYTSKSIPAEGGIKVSRLQTPWILFLELLIVTLLVLSLAMPVVLSSKSQVSIILILDNSYSMLAEPPNGHSALHKAKKYIRETIFKKSYYKVSMILAGTESEILGKYDMTVGEANLYLDSWKGDSLSGDIVEAIRLANDAFDENSKLIVFTNKGVLDEEQVVQDNLLWLGFGEPVDNLAITGANRYSFGDMDRCFFEFTNFSREAKDFKGIIKFKDSEKPIKTLNVNLPSRGYYREFLNLPVQNREVCAQIISDDFTLDNEVFLPPTKRPKVKIFIDVSSFELENLLKYTIKAVGIGEILTKESINTEYQEKVDILITDKSHEVSGAASGWRFISPEYDADSYRAIVGVAYKDQEHPLCLGLPSVRGGWPINEAFESKGTPLIMMNAVTLLSVVERDPKEIYLNLGRYSTLSSTNFWPILFYNLLAWYQEETSESTSAAKGFSREESCFLELNSTHLPSEILAESDMQHFVNVRWWFIIAALILICLHSWLTIRRKGFVY